MYKLSIIMPAYNEEKRIGATLEEYSNYFENMCKEGKIDYEIIVVINNTEDNTENIVKHYIEKNNRIRCLNFRQGGKGFAVIEGFKDALKRDFDILGFVDADMATRPEDFYYLVKNIKDNDVVIANRYHKKSIIYPPVTFRRLIVGRIFNYFVRSLLFINHADTQCGAKLFKRGAIEKTIPKLTMSKWAFDVEMLYQMKKQNFKVVSLPTIWEDKEYSKINFVRAGPWMALGVIRLRIINSPLRPFVKFYDKAIKFVPK